MRSVEVMPGRGHRLRDDPQVGSRSPPHRKPKAPGGFTGATWFRAVQSVADGYS